jgi:hypothetical protein
MYMFSLCFSWVRAWPEHRLRPCSVGLAAPGRPESLEPLQ